MLKNKIILHIDINAFFASVEEANNPSLKNKPIVVAGKTKRSVVSCPNYAARKYGIKAAMPIFQAKNLCKNLIIVSHKFNLYEKYSEKFIDLLSEKISNRIEYISLDECYMDVTNLVTEKQTPKMIAEKIQKIVKQELGLGTSIGISYNKFLAKMGSDYKKPMGITEILNNDKVKKIIWPQPIGNMYFVGKSTEKALIENQIKTIGHLANCNDYDFLESVFGKNWEHFLDNANGIGEDELTYSYGEPKSVSVSKTLLTDTNDYSEIKVNIKEFAKEISERLSRYDLVGKTLSVYVKDPEFKLHTKNKTLKNYIYSYEQMLVVFLEMYQKHFLDMKIRLVGVGISNLINKEPEMCSELFDKKQHKSTHKKNLYDIADEINHKFSKNILRVGFKSK